MENPVQPLMVFHSRGNIELLSQDKLAIFASRSAPEEISNYAQTLFKKLLTLPLSLAGGWQSSLEKQLLLSFSPSATANLIHYFARELNQLTLDELHQKLLAEGKLLMIAPETTAQRPSQTLIRKRDELIFNHCRKILFLFIQPEGRLQRYLDQLEAGPHSLFVLQHPLNAPWFSSNVVPLSEDNLDVLLAEGKF